MVFRKRRFEHVHQSAFLEQLGKIRRAVIEAWQAVPFGNRLYDIGGNLTRDIDDAAEIMTGDREHFWLQPHSTPPEGGHKPLPERDPIDAESVARGIGRKP